MFIMEPGPAASTAESSGNRSEHCKPTFKRSQKTSKTTDASASILCPSVRAGNASGRPQACCACCRLLPAALTQRKGLCNFCASWIGNELHTEPTCAGAESLVASGQCLHRSPGADAVISGPCASCPQSERWILSDLQFLRMDGPFRPGTACRIRSHRLLSAASAASDPVVGLRSSAEKGSEIHSS